MLKYKNKIIAAVIILAVLIFVFWWGGNSQSLHGFNVNKPDEITTLTMPDISVLPVISSETMFSDSSVIPEIQTEENVTASDIPQSDNADLAVSPVPDEEEQLAENTFTEELSENSENKIPDYSGAENLNKNNLNVSDKTNNYEDENKEMHCTLSVSCTSIIENISVPSEKRNIIPENGIIYAPKSVIFYEGETVFDILKREMQNNHIHLEFSKTPLYDSYYIEGINNIYEFDFGELSGWIYSVNGIFPQYSSSQYILKDGDNISWIYSVLP